MIDTQNSSKKLILVAGGGGFIGGHLVAELLRQGHRVRAVDIKPFDRWYQVFPESENIVADLRLQQACHDACRHTSEVYNLAADMGGMGFIETHKAECMLSVLINTHLLVAARDLGVSRFFYASSACVYNADKQQDANVTALREHDAYPAMPEDGYGWEKLFSERMCRHFREDYGIHTRVARFHNVYGPHGTWQGGREKAPAAICRKVLESIREQSGEIEIWGDGEQTRSFMFIEDCIAGILRIMHSNVEEPLNLGSSELVSINQLVDLVESFAQVKLQRQYNLDAPKGVRGRNSDNQLIRSYFNWEPSISLREGMRKTYEWIRGEFEPFHNDQDPTHTGGVPGQGEDAATTTAAKSTAVQSEITKNTATKNTAVENTAQQRMAAGTHRPLLSIGMPVFNAEAYLAESLDSLLSQSFSDFELIISDNGSSDGTQQICREYAARDSRVNYCRESENRGAAWNFNRVFENSQGKYFKWAAADDVCAPTYLETCIELLERDPQVVACHTRTKKIDGDGQLLVQLADPTRSGAAQRRQLAGGDSAAVRFADVLLNDGWSVRSYSVVRREALAKTSLIQACYGWEKVTMAELALQGQFHIVDKQLFSQRIHANASSNLRNGREEARFFAPQAKSLGKATRFRLLQGHLAAVFHHRLTSTQRVRCLLAIGRYLGQFHKWSHVVQGMLGNGSIGNAGMQLSTCESQPTRLVSSVAAEPRMSGKGIA